ncbi:uncharacterized protein LOC106137816 [Amyelois transitella]|uniref:uncharacterized protein LOC106137816 n=1 Tax=Amyelois transitella TaxID=680683 RepID=UPI00298F738D|nr:uncharacterized protein LOC106137816 [Amyelois transitella]
MKAAVVVLLFCLHCSVECRKTYAPIDKNANLAFINMEGGGGARPPSNQKPAVSSNQQPPLSSNQQPPPSSPGKPSSPTKVNPPQVSPTQPPAKPIVTMVAPTPAKPQPHVNPTPAPVKPNPVKPGSPVTTPGPGSVKQLVNFYDSQGKASVIRPYSYSQAVKQG